MSDSAEPKRVRRARRPDPAVMRRSGLDRIGAELDAAIPPPNPPGLGEGMLERATHGSGLERLLGELFARMGSNGDLIAETREQVGKMDDKLDALARRLDGVAYKEDIRQFMTRDEIERKIEKSATDVKVDLKADIRDLRKMGWALLFVTLVGAVGLVVKLFAGAAHISV